MRRAGAPQWLLEPLPPIISHNGMGAWQHWRPFPCAWSWGKAPPGLGGCPHTATRMLQGMSDLVSPLLAVLRDEAETFWAF